MRHEQAFAVPGDAPVDEVQLEAAVNDLIRVRGRLSRCIGSKYRALERVIRDIAARPDDCCEATWDDGTVVLAPSGRLTEALREARRLGVLA